MLSSLSRWVADRLTVPERVEVVSLYYDSAANAAETAKKFNAKYPDRIPICTATVNQTVRKFEQTGSVIDKKPETDFQKDIFVTSQGIRNTDRKDLAKSGDDESNSFSDSDFEAQESDVLSDIGSSSFKEEEVNLDLTVDSVVEPETIQQPNPLQLPPTNRPRPSLSQVINKLAASKGLILEPSDLFHNPRSTSSQNGSIPVRKRPSLELNGSIDNDIDSNATSTVKVQHNLDARTKGAKSRKSLTCDSLSSFDNLLPKSTKTVDEIEPV